MNSKRKEQWGGAGVKPLISKGQETLLTPTGVTGKVPKLPPPPPPSMQMPKTRGRSKVPAAGCSFAATKRLQGKNIQM